ncbi:hypothetical protein [Gordonia sp. (in: high G+C Gram-positive bacteria)]|uniref:hypothetical protein n=1 Tax=Gordonia sp. (in: high G+C Gram-positive bacteria) TaxID=84139 RepID=UPI003C723363
MIGSDFMDNEILAILDSFPPVESSSGDFKFTASTVYQPPASMQEIKDWEERSSCRAGVLNDLWSVTRTTRLYYSNGGSGLTLLSPEDSALASVLGYELDEDGFHERDVVIGKFEVIPDSIIYSPEEDVILWAGVIDSRDDWDRFESVANFLGEYKNYPNL